MSSRKQRRRRQKERRHEYEYVYVDDEGHEVPVDPAEVKEPRPPKPDRAPASRAKGRTSARTTRPGRKVEPPSWRRVGRRALLFAPMMFAAIYLLGGKKLTLAQEVTQTVVLLLFFLPFSYFMDSLMYRQYVRRTGGEPPTRRERTS